MKKVTLSLLGVILFLSTQAQTHVILHLVQKAGSADFGLNNTVTASGGYDYQPTRLQYYLSQPAVFHDGGQMSPASTRYFLIDASQDVTLDLGEMEVENVEGIIFSIGVDEARNHLDPSNYPPGHPLAPQNPTMHWGWAAGYKFIAFDGKVGSDFSQTFEIHSIGDELYQTVNLNTDAQPDGDNLIIQIQADYNKLLENIDVSGGIASHGNLGPAATIMENIGSLVFSALSPTSVQDTAVEPSFFIAPNPAASGFGQVVFELPSGNEYALTVCDLTGRVLSQRPLWEGRSFVQLEAPGAGMYLVQLWQNSQPVHTEKWVVTKG
ncbi:MAG: T9SS type A sorting domain-containing protein [Saprospirales bacterium]|nr:T9SS type A sorting domain-containing protein [Saprospirales bacterium]